MIHHLEVQVLILLLIASLVGMTARRLRVPYTLALVVAGLALSFLHLEALNDLQLTPDLLLLLFLPPLLFEAAYHLPFDDVRKNAVHIFFLAIIGVVVSMVVTAGAAYAGMHLTGVVHFHWSHAFLFGAVIAATDPISVLAFFRELGAPKRLYQIVEGESLVNDGVAVVVFAIVVSVVGAGSEGPVVLVGFRAIASHAVIAFFRTGVGGLLAGAAVGALASVTTRHIDDHLIEVTLTTLVAWGSFLVAEQLHVSGVLSTVSAGVMMGSFGKHYGMSASTRVAVTDFWEYMGFISNSFIFLLIGLELEPWTMLGDIGAIVVAFVAMMMARAVLIYAGVPIADRFATPLPPKWRHVLVWGGLRGSLSMVLVLGLPTDFVGRKMLIELVFGVVAISLFLQGLTMAPLMRRLKLVKSGGLATTRAYGDARGRAIAYQRVINEADALLAQGIMDEPSHRRLHGWYDRERERSHRLALTLAGETAQPERLLEAARTLGNVEREAIARAVHEGVISEDTASKLLTDIDRRLDALDRASHEGERELLESFDALYNALEEEPPSGPRED